jgi:UDP-N-acetylglucosamine 2-epimerase (non-hydrolysing)
LDGWKIVRLVRSNLLGQISYMRDRDGNSGYWETKDRAHVLHVVGARPNFMKAAPVLRALSGELGIRQTLVHTGQHYDVRMSEIFFQQLAMPQPDFDLEVGSGSHAAQTAQIMVRFEPIVLEQKPNLVMVYGDVNSTLAAALVCSKLHVAVAHVEAGLRSRDHNMPEEINRILTDQISDLLFTPSFDGNENLMREGIAADKVHLVGNVMIDTLVRLLPESERFRFARASSPYALVTLHRPSNVDDLAWLQRMIQELTHLSRDLNIVFPVHPRTSRRLSQLGWSAGAASCLHLLEPQSYLEFLALQRDATVVITDSGGIQEESSFLRVPCVTVRETTERPITVDLGTNRLAGRDIARIVDEVHQVLAGNIRQGAPIPLWDGRAAERIAGHVVGFVGQETPVM